MPADLDPELPFSINTGLATVTYQNKLLVPAFRTQSAIYIGVYRPSHVLAWTIACTLFQTQITLFQSQRETTSCSFLPLPPSAVRNTRSLSLTCFRWISTHCISVPSLATSQELSIAWRQTLYAVLFAIFISRSTLASCTIHRYICKGAILVKESCTKCMVLIWLLRAYIGVLAEDRNCGCNICKEIYDGLSKDWCECKGCARKNVMNMDRHNYEEFQQQRRKNDGRAHK